MIIDGNLDLSFDADYLAAPDEINWPAPIKKALAVYETVWNAWAAAEADLQTLLIDRDNAPALDGDLMRAAVREGKPDPGTPHQAKAARAVVYAKESTRQAAAKAREAADAIRADVAVHADALILEAIQVERVKVDALMTAQKAAQAAWIDADDNARTIGASVNWLLSSLGDARRAYRVEYASLPVAWPALHQLAQPRVVRTLDALEAAINPGPTPARTSENTFSE